MNQQNKYRVNGAIFQNNKPNGPMYSGVVEIDGVKTYIALWEKRSAAGNDYLQISEDKKAADKAAGNQSQQGGGAANRFARPAPQRAPTPPAAKNADMDDDIPF